MLFAEASIKKQVDILVCEGRGAKPAGWMGWTRFQLQGVAMPRHLCSWASRRTRCFAALLVLANSFGCLLAEHAQHGNNSSAHGLVSCGGGNSCSVGCLMAWECCSQRAGCLPDPECLCPGPIRKSFVPCGSWREGGWLVIVSDALCKEWASFEFRLSASGLGGSTATPRHARAGRFCSAAQCFSPRGIRECPWVCPAPGGLEVEPLRCSAGLWH